MDKLAVLKKIAHSLNENEVHWAVGASLLLYFHDLVTEFHDIDIVVEIDDVDKLKNCLNQFGTLLPENSKSQYGTRYFLEYQIEDVDVDAMAGFTVFSDGEEHDCSFHREHIAEYKNLDGVMIPLDSLSNWAKYYRLMGRKEKSELCKQH